MMKFSVIVLACVLTTPSLAAPASPIPANVLISLAGLLGEGGRPSSISHIHTKEDVSVSNARDAQTIEYTNEIIPNGAFHYFFKTNNGIEARAEGSPRSFYSGADEVSPVVKQGSFAWTSPEGQDISISYVADENGYRPTGNAIPQAPEIPPAILRSLEFIARSLPTAAAVSSK